MKQIHIHKKPSRWEQIRENLITPHKILLLGALIASGVLYLFIPITFALIPFYIHCILYAITYYKHVVMQFRKSEIWKTYIDRYGDKNGMIPRQTRLNHEKLIRQGKKIEL